MRYLVIAPLILAFIACDNDDDNGSQQLEGTWNISEMSYVNSLGESQVVSNSSTTLLFTTNSSTDNLSSGELKKGVQDVGSEEFDFNYSANFSRNTIDVLLNQSDRAKLPPDAVGRIQVYRFERPSDDFIELYASEEADYAEGKFGTYRNVRYKLQKQQ